MYLQRLSLINFKNIREAEPEFCRKVNCFVGDNGTGKTNLIDAIHYLSMCKSAFNVTDGQSINHDADFFMLDGQYLIEETRRENISCGFKRGNGKVLKRNGKEYDKLSEHIGLLPVVLVSPSDTSLIHESGEDRRKYINALLSQLDKEYLQNLIRYNHILAERNRLLKQAFSANFTEILDVLDMQLIEYGERIFRRRQELTEQLSPIVERYYSILSDEKESVEISYKSDLKNDSFQELLKASFEKDRILQHTTTGIHRDDIRMRISGYPLRKFGSQGQQKSFLVALKLAQFEIITAHCHYKPILLLDDIFDKLDLQRVERLIRLVSDERFGQIFITDSNKVRLDLILEGIEQDYRLFTVSQGEIQTTEA